MSGNDVPDVVDRDNIHASPRRSRTMTDRLDTRFHALHADGLLRLANAWDAGSARLAQAVGARAGATSRAAAAGAHAWPDGDALPHELLLSTVRAVAGAVALPVS